MSMESKTNKFGRTFDMVILGRSKYVARPFCFLTYIGDLILNARVLGWDDSPASMNYRCAMST
jgi:hypothetical protein